MSVTRDDLLRLWDERNKAYQEKVEATARYEQATRNYWAAWGEAKGQNWEYSDQKREVQK